MSVLSIVGLPVSVIALLVCLGFADQTPVKPSSVLTHGKWRDIRGLWTKRSKAIPLRSKDAPRRSLNIMLDLLDEAPKEQVDAELERVRNLPTNPDQMSDYDLTLLQAFVVKFRYEREKGEIKLRDPEDKEGLAYLLSGKFPRYIGTVPMELFLTVGSIENVGLLFDSYERSATPDTQQAILAALSSAFSKLRGEHEDNREFVSACKAWFLKNKSRLTLNPYYVPDSNLKSTKDFFILRDGL